MSLKAFKITKIMFLTDDEAAEMKVIENDLQNALHKLTKLNKIFLQKQKEKQGINFYFHYLSKNELLLYL